MQPIEFSWEDFDGYKAGKQGLKDQGLVYIVGENHDTESSNSNGSGKSTIYRALSWGLFGQTVDGLQHDEVIRRGQKKATVSVVFRDLFGKDWVVKRTRSKGKPNLSIIQPDGKPMAAGTSELQEKIIEWLGQDFQTFRNSTLYGQGDIYRFADPRTKDSQRKEMLHKILRTNILKRCHELALKKRRQLAEEIEGVESEISSLDARLEEHDLEALREQLDEWTASREERIMVERGQASDEIAKIKKMKTDIEKLPSLRRKVVKLAAAAEIEVDKDGSAIELLEKDIEKAQDEAAKVNKERAEIRVKLRDVIAQLKRFDAKRCPTCNTPFEESSYATELIAGLRLCRGKLESRDEILLLAETEVLPRLKRLKNKLGDARVLAQRKIEAARKRTNDWLAAKESLLDMETVKHTITKLQSAVKERLARIREMQEEKNPIEGLLVDAESKCKKYKKERLGFVAKLNFLRKQYSEVSFWVKGFSSQGLPSFLLDNVMGYITQQTNYYLGVLADGDISMYFSTQRELKSKRGEIRDEIQITWDIEGKGAVRPSGGQQKKMFIAVDFALMDLVASREGALDFLMLDEVLDGLDSEARTRVIALLQELRSRKSTIFVISHAIDMAEGFDRIICPTMRDGIATLEMNYGL